MKPLVSPMSRVLGWGWVAVVALLLVDLVLNGDGASSMFAGAVLLFTVGGAYVLWLRPRVVPTDEGVRLVNPLRETFVPWSVFTWADVTDVLRVHAGDRVYRSWPLRETKRAKVRENLRRAGDGPVPALDEGTDPRSLRPVDFAARQLREEAERRKAQPQHGSGDGATVQREPATVWAPDAAAALGIPVFLLVMLFFVV
ncbi:hypothetical protein GCM10027570_47740 [Streptomonospora sediminis]